MGITVKTPKGKIKSGVVNDKTATEIIRAAAKRVGAKNIYLHLKRHKP